MKKQQILFSILLIILCMMFFDCEAMGELFHGPKPEKSPGMYTVTFNANGADSGTAPAAMKADDGSSITLPSGSGLSKTGYTFGGWNTNASGKGTNYNAGSSYTVTRKVTLYAKWNAVTATSCTVTFDANGADGGATPAAMTANDGSNITLPSGSGLSRTGYTFGGWNTDAIGTGINYNAEASYTVTGSITLYAFWNNSTETYTVSFDRNGGSGTAPSAQTASSGSAITLPLGIGLSKTGYTFDGWNANTSGTGTNYNAGSSYTVTGNVTLYAKWTPIYTVSFDRNGGSGSAPSARTGSWHSAITLPSAGIGLFRAGYTFAGWNTNSSGTGTNYNAGSSYTVTGNITLYAKWELVITNVPGSTLAAKLAWLQTNAVSYVDYTVEVNADESIAPHTLSYSGKTNIGITLKGVDTERVISLSSVGAMFTVASGVTLVLDNNITLQGRSDNTDSLVRVNSGGTLVMNTGSRITGNTSSGNGGGVSVSSGTFTMTGGEISGNTGYRGGGVDMYYGTFTMEGGEISNNTASVDGGGVYMIYDCVFTMTGGEISDNTATDGGGVYVRDGTFTMNGGEISNNTSSQLGGGVRMQVGTFTMTSGTISGNTSYEGGGVYLGFPSGIFTMSGGEISGNTTRQNGGGVCVGSGGIFNKTGGTITGYASDTVNGNVVKWDPNSSTVYNDRGHAVYVFIYSSGSGQIGSKRRENTAGPEVNLSSDDTVEPSTYSGEWED